MLAHLKIQKLSSISASAASAESAKSAKSTESAKSAKSVKSAKTAKNQKFSGATYVSDVVFNGQTAPILTFRCLDSLPCVLCLP